MIKKLMTIALLVFAVFVPGGIAREIIKRTTEFIKTHSGGGSVASNDPLRGIVPLRSTRKDVERVFGVPKAASDSISYYKLPNEIVVFHFEAEGCDTEMGKFGFGWNVPLGTVTNIGVIPRGTHRLDEYKSKSDFKADVYAAGFVYHSDRSAGITVETHENRVTLVEYYPGAAQANLQCPRTRECCIDFFPKFDEYANIPFVDEKARLDNFMIQLNAAFWRGTIQVLGPSRKDRERQLKLAARAKRYLVRERGAEPERLLIVDAGFHEVSLTRLAEHSIGGVGTRIMLSPQKDPENTPAAQRRTRTTPRARS